MRNMIKGGFWKNTEDEILKAAVMKYGKNQWARISSLLVRKTPKQCKARWYEWLDPSIKKTEWSREEEEKLLHLAKLMPCQWRTIAPIIGRTPAQCLEHYEKLLDQAQGRDEDMDKDDPRKIKPGEVDPAPETKPAKPDPVDMDEDEKEMLAEARARLANTQGKKAKRKAREKQLEEARRLASLQKRRELKAAGIELHERRRRQKGLDYNAEIPFEKKPAPGFYDTSDERVRNKGKDFTSITLQEMEGKRRREIEEEQKKRDIKRQKAMKDAGVVPTVQINKLATPQGSKRSKLELPSPQVSEQDLEEIVKIGYSSEMARAAVVEEGSQASKTLLADYNLATPNPAQLRTPATVDRVMLEAQNNLILREMQTPLLGNELEPLKDVAGNFQGITPKRDMHTPNPLMQTPRGSSVSSTPIRGGTSVQATPLRTPMRDQLSINRGAVGDTPRLEKLRQSQIREDIRQGLTSLPKPKNDIEFDITLPFQNEEEDTKETVEADWVEDAADRESRRRQQQQEQEIEKLSLRSQAVQRGLPRPATLNKAMIAKEGETDLAHADLLLKTEILSMLQYDSVHYPFRGAKPKSIPTDDYEQFSKEELLEAVELVDQELESIKHAPSYQQPNPEDFARIWTEINHEFIFLPSTQKYGRSSQVSKAEKISSLQNQFEINRSHINKDAKKASKIEQKLGVLLGGYQNRSHALRKQLIELSKKIAQSTWELESFKRLAELEAIAIPKRVNDLQAEVDQSYRKEAELQRKYANLLVERETLLAQLAA